MKSGCLIQFGFNAARMFWRNELRLLNQIQTEFKPDFNKRNWAGGLFNAGFNSNK